jgi:hypothetical protein
MKSLISFVQIFAWRVLRRWVGVIVSAMGLKLSYNFLDRASLNRYIRLKFKLPQPQSLEMVRCTAGARIRSNRLVLVLCCVTYLISLRILIHGDGCMVTYTHHHECNRLASHFAAALGISSKAEPCRKAKLVFH